MVVSLAAFLVAAPRARAADHLDGPAAKAAPEADITDVYAWMNADKSKTFLIMNVSPMATNASKFSDSVQYVIHLNSQSAYGATTGVKSVNIICTFDAAQKASCWLGPATLTGISTASDFATGDASDPKKPIVGMYDKLTVFAGLRDDPFFFNLEGFQATEALVEAAAAMPGFAKLVDPSGCPHLDSTTAGALASQLSHAKDGSPAKDFFAKLNVLSIVVSVPTADVTPGGPILGVWASTHRKP
jgi:hypothetical protein